MHLLHVHLLHVFLSIHSFAQNFYFSFTLCLRRRGIVASACEIIQKKTFIIFFLSIEKIKWKQFLCKLKDELNIYQLYTFLLIAYVEIKLGIVSYFICLPSIKVILRDYNTLSSLLLILSAILLYFYHLNDTPMYLQTALYPSLVSILMFYFTTAK